MVVIKLTSLEIKLFYHRNWDFKYLKLIHFTKRAKINSADFGDIRLLAGFDKSGPVRGVVFHARCAAREKRLLCHPMQSSLADVAEISGIAFMHAKFE